MKTTSKLFAPIVLLLLLSAAPELTANADSDNEDAELQAFKAAIRDKYNIKERAFAENDIEPILTQFYTDDVISTGEGVPVHRGRSDLRELYEKVIADTVRIESVHARVNGDMGWDWTNFYVTPADESVEPFSFKMLFLWERIDGEWWCRGDIFVAGKIEAH